MQTQDTITSAQNPKIKALLQLQQKSACRREQGLFVVEGRRELMHCLSKGYQADTLFICTEILKAEQEYDNLLAVDVVCHGVPSPLVWRKYLEETRENLRAGRDAGKNTVSSSLMDLPVITGISFRDKTHGWKKYGFRLRYAASEAAGNSVSISANDRTFLQPFPDNVFMKGFLANLYLRPSCYACAARSGKSGSDISIADFWGVQNYYPEYDDDKGIGLVLVNTNKGRKAYEQVNADSIESTYEQGLSQNPCLEHSVAKTKHVGTFWKEFEAKGMAVVKEVELGMRPSIIKRFINRVKYFIRRILSRITDTKHNHNKA
jgi:hypothetical protein